MFPVTIPNPNLIRLQPFYPGQMGVSGSDVPIGLRNASSGRTFWVDENHPDANDTHDGTDPEHPLLTITAATNRLLIANGGLNGDQIYVYPGAYVESVQILDYTLYASYCSIIGLGNSMFSPSWDSGGAALPCLVAGAIGWMISGIRFYVPANAAAVVIPCTQAPWGANAIGIRTKLVGNYFDGSVNAGLYGIDLHGAPYNPEIIGNKFAFIDTGGGTGFAIVSTNTAYADAYRAVIAFNWFHENENHIDASLNVSNVWGNFFSNRGVQAAAIVLDLRLGTRGRNIVSMNYFEDADYSQPGGYWANAALPGGWNGNLSMDVAEAEVADNGWTILPPAP